MKKLRVLDFFCGAGGFSEGFRQCGFQIVYGFDHWKPAVETYNLNFNLQCEQTNILDFSNSVEEIEKLPDTEIIIGSPPCVSFSSSNKSGGADKSVGIQLTETFLKIIAVKKFQKNSILEAWFMENVVNVRKYIKEVYTFEDLGLCHWAMSNGIPPSNIAINMRENATTINSADFGAYQARKRLVAGEFIRLGKLTIPKETHSIDGKNGTSKYLTLDNFKQNFPTPFENCTNVTIKDPQYPLVIPQLSLTDHFYDTGIYEVEWNSSKYWKTNHPYMGKMSFPENANKPSRTITATKIANSRESIIYKSEIARVGDGEYRLPTVREAAVLMGFPISYQFIGSENTKWRLIGNAVCCSVSRALARAVLEELGFPVEKLNVSIADSTIGRFNNLNTYKLKSFLKVPTKKKGSRFRRHAIKDGNLTVTLSNYEINNEHFSSRIKWYTSIQYGSGKGFPLQKVPDGQYKVVENIIKKLSGGENFLNYMKNNFVFAISSADEMQRLYELQSSGTLCLNPNKLVDLIGEKINSLFIDEEEIDQLDVVIFKHKARIPKKQFFALYAINLISSIANENSL